MNNKNNTCDRIILFTLLSYLLFNNNNKYKLLKKNENLKKKQIT